MNPYMVQFIMGVMQFIGMGIMSIAWLCVGISVAKSIRIYAKQPR